MVNHCKLYITSENLVDIFLHLSGMLSKDGSTNGESLEMCLERCG